KSEELVPLDRSADRTAERIDVRRSARLTRQVRVVSVGVESRILEQFVRGAVKPVRSRLRGDADDTARRPAILRVVDRSLHAKLLRRGDGRNVSDRAGLRE